LISIYNFVLGLVGFGLVNYGLGLGLDTYGLGLGGSGRDSITGSMYYVKQRNGNCKRPIACSV